MLQNFYTSIKKMFYNRLIYDIMSSDIISAHIGFGGTAKPSAKICRGYYTRKDLGRQDINAMNFEENLRYNNDYKRGKKKLQDLSKRRQRMRV